MRDCHSTRHRRRRPRAVSIVERLAARAVRAAVPAPFEVHVFDPYPVGPGEVWRLDQDPHFLNNTSALRNTLFTDDAVPMSGPIAPGPTVAEWIGEVAPTLPIAREAWMGPEIARFRPWHKPSRRLQGQYFRWVLDQAVDAARGAIEVHEHRARVIDVAGSPDGAQTVVYRAGGRTRHLTADLVVSAQGFLPDREQNAENAGPGIEADSAVAAVSPGSTDATEPGPAGTVPTAGPGRRLPARLAADLDLDALPAGEDVIVSAMGATFFDLVGALYAGRGGRYERDRTGTLTYRPSGREPRLLAGSRTGLPHRSQRFNDQRQYEIPRSDLLRPRNVQRLLAEHRGRHDVDVRDEIWPAFLAEASALFEERAARLRAKGTAVDPEELLRFDWPHLVQPAAGREFASVAEWEDFVDAYSRREHLSRTDPDTSPWAGVHALVNGLRGLCEAGTIAGIFTPASQQGFIDIEILPAGNILASGPPDFRFEQLDALRRSGLVRFVGPEARVESDGERFVIESPAVAGSRSTARYWMQGRQAWGTLIRTADCLVSGWLARGEARLGTLDHPAPGTVDKRSLAVDADLHPVDVQGRVHERRIVLGCVAGRRQPGAGQIPIPHAGGTFLAGTDSAAGAAWDLAVATAHHGLDRSEYAEAS